MQAMPGGSMLSVPLSREQLEPMLTENISLAAVNAPSLCVRSGPHEAVEHFEKQLTQQGHNSTRLHTSHAFHSQMMEPVLAEFEKTVGTVTLKKPGLQRKKTQPKPFTVDRDSFSLFEPKCHINYSGKDSARPLG